MTWEMIELKEGEPVVFLAVHALRWRQEWGEPAAGFVQSEVDIDALQAENERLRAALRCLYECASEVEYKAWPLMEEAKRMSLEMLKPTACYTPPAITAELDLETKAGSPQPKDIDPLGLELP